MGSLNQYSVIGNLAGDPTLRKTNAGKSVSNFRIAVNEVHINKETGEKTDVVTWISCTAWNQLAEFIAGHLKKGAQIYVDGKLRTQTWDKKVKAPVSGEEFTVKMDSQVLIVDKVVPSYYPDKEAPVEVPITDENAENDLDPAYTE